jgi:hypothetical protein
LKVAIAARLLCAFAGSEFPYRLSGCNSETLIAFDGQLTGIDRASHCADSGIVNLKAVMRPLWWRNATKNAGCVDASREQEAPRQLSVNFRSVKKYR